MTNAAKATRVNRALPAMRVASISLGAMVPDLARGLRAAVATLIPFFLAAQLERHELAWTALAGWLGTLADPSGSRTTRAKTILAFAMSGALVLVVAEWSHGSLVGATLTLGAVAFGASLLRALGAAPSTVGTMLAIIAAIATAKPASNPWHDAIAFAAGAAWATVLSSIVWPVWTHLPVRRALATVFDELAAYSDAVAACVEASAPADDLSWAMTARKHRRKVRDAIEAARTMALQVRARRPGESRVGGNLRMLLGMAESEFTLFLAMAERVEGLAIDERPRAAVFASLSAPWKAMSHVLGSYALRAMDAPARVSLPPLEGGVARLSARLAGAIADALALLSALDAPGDAPPHDTTSPPPSTLRDSWCTLRDALSPKSAYFRHALRVAGAVIVASAVGRRISPDHAHWVTVTTLAVLQPYPGATTTRAVERVLGTILGGLVAVALSMTIQSPRGLAAVMFPLSIAAVATKPRSYRLFTFFLTPVFVLLAERHAGDWWTAAARAGDAVTGGVIALIAALAVFPSWERKRMPEALGAIRTTMSLYAAAVLAPSDDEDDAATQARVLAARRTAAVALSDAETSLERLLAEPLRKLDAASDAMHLVTYVRRLAGALTTWWTDARDPAKSTEAAAVLAFVTRALDGDDPGDEPKATDPQLARAVRYAAFIARTLERPHAH